MKRRRRSSAHGLRTNGSSSHDTGGHGDSANGKQPVTLITGGAGFIGSNLANALLQRGHLVTIIDNLSRPGVEHNLAWLRRMHGSRLGLMVGDIRDQHALSRVVAHANRVYHFAAQVAVTTSCQDPITDFEVNARGTLNLLEALRALPSPPPLVFTSTNKVYGALADVALRATSTRYEPEDQTLRERGIDENRHLEFHSPYGCSKGVADQYVLDYARCFSLPTVVFRMSCIYGGRQFGNEEQGWVAHFVRQAEAGRPITIYGDGRQVRDVLHVDDLIQALLLAAEHAPRLSGQAFNMGGGPDSAISLLELLEHIRGFHGKPPEVSFCNWRTGDQRYYVSNAARFRDATGWQPRISVADGLARLRSWARDLECHAAQTSMYETDVETRSVSAQGEPGFG